MNRRRAHLIVAAIWTALIIPAAIWWSESLPFLTAASLWANLYSALSAYEAASDSLTEADKQWLINLLEKK